MTRHRGNIELVRKAFSGHGDRLARLERDLPEVASLSKAVASLNTAHGVLMAHYNQFRLENRGHLDTLAKDVSAHLTDLTRRIEALERRLESLQAADAADVVMDHERDAAGQIVRTRKRRVTR